MHNDAIYWFTVKSFVIGIYFKSNNNNKILFSFLITGVLLDSASMD